MIEEICEWTEDGDGDWETKCGMKFCLIDGDPADNGMRFCCYCGCILVERAYTEESENENP